MKGSSRRLWVAGVAAPLFVLACVTINIYFPAEKVEAVAEDIVDEIRGQKGKERSAPAPKSESLLRSSGWLCLGAHLAWAADVTSVANPTIRALKQNMKARYAQMKPYYQSGALVEANNGYVSVANTAGLNLKQQRDLRSLVQAENQDRRALYQEVARALNIDPSQIDRVASIFAKEWQKPLR
jgi:uncharacterized protein YdbL (DUF1318 family)